MEDIVRLLPFVGIAVLFWFLLIRPQAKRQRDMRELQNALAAGDEVMLTSGIFGTVREIDEDDVVHVDVAPGTTLRVVRAAVGRVVERAGVDPAHDTGHDAAHEGGDDHLGTAGPADPTENHDPAGTRPAIEER